LVADVLPRRSVRVEDHKIDDDVPRNQHQCYEHIDNLPLNKLVLANLYYIRNSIIIYPSTTFNVEIVVIVDFTV
jgi:hypothetical protein